MMYNGMVGMQGLSINSIMHVTWFEIWVILPFWFFYFQEYIINYVICLLQGKGLTQASVTAYS